MKRDIMNNTKALEALAIQELAENDAAIQTASGLDRVGFEGCLAEVHFSGMAEAVTGGTIVVTIYDGDAANSLAVTTDQKTYTFDGDDKSGVIRVPYTGIKQFVGVDVDNNLTGGEAGANTINVGATLLLGYPRTAPVTQDLTVA